MIGTHGKRRASIVRRLPVALMEYAFECFAAILGALMGLALVAGAVRPDSLFAALPSPVVYTYAVSSIMGAGTIFAGLVSRPRNPILMAVGLRLFAVVIGVYAVAVVAFAGVPKGGLGGLFFALIAALAGFRSFYLRANAEEAYRAHRGR